MSFYRFAYWIGFKPWERDQARQAGLISGLFDREEKDRERPFGPMLDLGCGTGIQSVALARRGWQVTGIDSVPRAVRIARERARKAGVEARFIEGDVTTLRAAGVGDGIRFFLDFGCFHGLDDPMREAMGREVNAIAAPAATMLMFAFAPARRGPFPRGATGREIEAALSGWRVIAEDEVNSSMPKRLQHGTPRIFRLRRG
ncbi:MAG: class I SAM-dependent methyltransferase [Opitutaceae bacterium]